MESAGSAEIIDFLAERARRIEEVTSAVEAVVPVLTHPDIIQSPAEVNGYPAYSPAPEVKGTPEAPKPCYGETDLFFGPYVESQDDRMRRVARARAICRLCDICEPCLRGAIKRREPAGVWGGEEIINGRIVTGLSRRGRPIL